MYEVIRVNNTNNTEERYCIVKNESDAREISKLLDKEAEIAGADKYYAYHELTPMLDVLVEQLIHRLSSSVRRLESKTESES